ncbi:MAG: EamA family transporter [Magnetococcales bacterium]|nr:EamA family transporter [Magnetococcales bacterium]
MPIWMAFLTLTFIWGSTPLAIQWSQAGMSYSFAVMARIGIGVVLFLLLIPWLKRHPAPSLGQLLVVSLIAGLNLFGSMLCVYWGARYIPSGWISVLFGLGPILTGWMAAAWLKEPFSRQKWIGSLMGLFGLVVIFAHSGIAGENTPIGIAAVILSVVIYAAGNVGIKQWNRDIAPMWVAAGSLWVAFPLFLIVFLLSGEPWPTEALYTRSGLAIVYLGLVGNGLGFVCFYYLLSRVSAANASLVTLSSPAVALWLGVAFNREQIHGGLLLGTILILAGLALFQWGLPGKRLQNAESL